MKVLIRPSILPSIYALATMSTHTPTITTNPTKNTHQRAQIDVGGRGAQNLGKRPDGDAEGEHGLGGVGRGEDSRREHAAHVA